MPTNMQLSASIPETSAALPEELPVTRPRRDALITGQTIEVAGLKVGSKDAITYDPEAICIPVARNERFLAAHIRHERGVTQKRWKLHVSAYPHNAADIANIVLPILCELGIWHKYVESPMTLSRMLDEQRGKFITIYTCVEKNDDPVIVRIVGRPTAVLGHFAGPVIAGEDVFGHLLYGRYSHDYAAPGG